MSRGVRFSKKQFGDIYETWQTMREDQHIQMNQVIRVLLELGITTYGHLSSHLQHALFSHRNDQEELKLQTALEPTITRIASRLRADDKLTVRIPHAIKLAIRQDARQADTTMSELVRPRIITKETA